MEMTEVMLSVGVKAVTGTHLDLSDGSSMPYGLAVWAAGNGPLPLVLDLIEAIDEQKEKASWGRCNTQKIGATGQADRASKHGTGTNSQ